MKKEKILQILKVSIKILVIANAICLLLFLIAMIATKVADDEFLLPIHLKVILLAMCFYLFIICFCYYFTVIIVRELYSLKFLLTIIIEHVFFIFVFFVDPFDIVPFFFG